MKIDKCFCHAATQQNQNYLWFFSIQYILKKLSFNGNYFLERKNDTVARKKRERERERERERGRERERKERKAENLKNFYELVLSVRNKPENGMNRVIFQK